MKRIIAIGLLVVLSQGFVLSAEAASAKDQFTNGVNATAGNAGYNNTDAENPQEVFTSKIASIIGVLLSMVGLIFLVLMIYGGYRWMMAKGNDSEVNTAKSIIINALIGLVVVMSAYAITQFVGKAATTSTQPIDIGVD